MEGLKNEKNEIERGYAAERAEWWEKFKAELQESEPISYDPDDTNFWNDLMDAWGCDELKIATFDARLS